MDLFNNNFADVKHLSTFKDLLDDLKLIKYTPDAFGQSLRNFTNQNCFRKINTLSLFSGAGGLDIGFEDAGFNIVEQVEMVKDFVKTLEINNEGFHSNVICTDIHDYNANKLKGKIDFIIGGPPCQPFSAASRRAFGVDGTINARGTLFNEYVRILKEVQPVGFLFENVYGIVSSNHGEDWLMIKQAFKDAGYQLYFRILDAADYGTPQHRERLIIVGLKNKKEFRFPRPTHGLDSPDNHPYFSAKEALVGIELDKLDEKKLKLTGRYGNLLPGIPVGMNYSYYTSKIGNPMAIFSWRSKFSDFLYKADPNQPVKTIKASGGQYTGPFHWGNRRFSISELKRLQTFPDNYTIYGGKLAKIKQIGNSVPPQFSRMLALSIRDQVFNMDNPIKINYLNKTDKLNFRGFKRKLSRSYYAKAESELSQIHNVDSQNDVINHSIFVKLTERLSLKETRKSDSEFRAIITSNSTTLSINLFDTDDRSENKEAQASIFISLFEPLDGKRMMQIKLISHSSNVLGFTTMWKVLENELQKNHFKADLVQLNGYYQYVPQMEMKGSFNSTFPIDNNLMQSIIGNVITGKLLTINEMSEMCGLSKDVLIKNLKLLKQIGYEIRNENTNVQIKKGMWMIPYAFPTLSDKSVQMYKSLNDGRGKSV